MHRSPFGGRLHGVYSWCLFSACCSQEAQDLPAVIHVSSTQLRCLHRRLNKWQRRGGGGMKYSPYLLHSGMSDHVQSKDPRASMMNGDANRPTAHHLFIRHTCLTVYMPTVQSAAAPKVQKHASHYRLMPSTTRTLSSIGAAERSNQKWVRTTENSESVTQQKNCDILRWLISSNESHFSFLFFFFPSFGSISGWADTVCRAAGNERKTAGIHLSHRCGSNLCLQALEVNSDRLKQWLRWLLTGASSESRPKETATSLETACQLRCRLIRKEPCTVGVTTYLIMAIMWRWNGTLGGLSCFFAVKTLFKKKKKRPSNSRFNRFIWND